MTAVTTLSAGFMKVTLYRNHFADKKLLALTTTVTQVKQKQQ